MKVKIVQPWIYRGTIRTPGEVLELPDDEGRAAALRGVVRPVIRRSRQDKSAADGR